MFTTDELQFIDEAIRLKWSEGNEWLGDLARTRGIERYIGDGAEKIVFADAQAQDRVISIFHSRIPDNDQIKQILYIHDHLHHLWPGSFPPIYGAYQVELPLPIIGTFMTSVLSFHRVIPYGHHYSSPSLYQIRTVLDNYRMSLPLELTGENIIVGYLEESPKKTGHFYVDTIRGCHVNWEYLEEEVISEGLFSSQ